MRATGLGKRRPHANPSFKLFTRPALLAHKSARFFQLVRSGISAKDCTAWCPAGVAFRTNRLGGSEKFDLEKVQSVELLASIK